MVYLDHAATTDLLACAKSKIIEVFEQWGSGKYANAGGLYKSANNSAIYLEQLRNKVKEMTNMPYVVFTSCASESNNMIFNHAKKVVTTKYEHPSTAKNPKAILLDSIKNLEQELEKEPCIFSICGVHHETGQIRNTETLYNLCKKHYCKIHIDASQMKTLPAQADFLTLSSHKIGGPIGIAALCSHEPIKAILFGGKQENDMRAGTQALPLISGFVEALEYMQLFDKTHFQKLKKALKEQIEPSYMLENYAQDNFADHIVCLVSQFPASEIAAFMDMNNIAVAIGSACTSGALDGMKILESFDNLPENIRNGIRVSFGYKTTLAETNYFCQKLNAFFCKRTSKAL